MFVCLRIINVSQQMSCLKASDCDRVKTDRASDVSNEVLDRASSKTKRLNWKGRKVGTKIATVNQCTDVTGQPQQKPDDVRVRVPDKTVLSFWKECAVKAHALDVQVDAVSFLCQKLDIPPDELLTEDVTANIEFMKALMSVSASAQDYFPLVVSWRQQQSFVKKGSIVQQRKQEADDCLRELSQYLQEVARGMQLMSHEQKLAKTREILPVLSSVKMSLRNAIDSLKASIRAQNARKYHRLKANSEYSLIAGNSPSLSWEEAIEKVAGDEVDGKRQLSNALNPVQLLSFPHLKDLCHRSGLPGVPGYVVAEHYDLTHDDKLKNAVEELVDVFPLLCVAKGDNLFLMDYVELVHTPCLVYELLTLDSVKDTETLSCTARSSSCSDDSIFFYQKPDNSTQQEKCPEFLDVMVSFVRLHGLGAHMRRRTGSATCCGVNLNDVRKHLLENVEGLDDISRTKICSLLQSAQSNLCEAACDKDAQIGTKPCDVSRDSPNAHEYMATVSNVRQMCAMYPDECVAFSCDSRAKVHIGGQAISKYHELRMFFTSDDVAHHNIPTPGCLVEPDGYLLLQPKDTETSRSKDKCGRDVPHVPSTGPLWVFNRCVKNTSTTIEDHVDDLRVLMKDNPNVNKPVLVLVSDDGPDWNPRFNVNEFFLGRLWREGKYDMLISVCIPARLSCHNPIEHLWSPCAKLLAGVSLPASLHGEKDPVALQNTSRDNQIDKEQRVCMNALDRLNMCWDGRFHDGFRITSQSVSPDANGTHNDVRRMFQSGLRAIQDDPGMSDILEEWKFLSKHMDRRRGFVCFRRGSCGETACECRAGAIRASKVWKIATGDKWLFPPITPDPEHPGHYKTFPQLERSLVFGSPDQHLKNFEAISCSRCRYIFTSKADEDRHMKLIHNGSRGPRSSHQEDRACHKCPVCSAMYTTRYRLLKHQEQEGHKLKKGRPSKDGIIL